MKTPMKTPLSVYVEVDDVVKLRELGLNSQEICRKAIKQAIIQAEREMQIMEKQEKERIIEELKNKGGKQ